MREYNTDILIVGAGPTGLLLACELARQGINFRIIERSQRPSQLSRGTGVHGLSLQILDDFGLGERAVSEGFWLPATSVYQDGLLVGRIPLGKGAAAADPASLLILEQAKVEKLLTEHLSANGVEVERRCELRGFEFKDGGVRATVARKKMLETCNCRYIVGCDGPKSTVREVLRIGFTGMSYPRPYLLAEVRMEWGFLPEMFRFIGKSIELVAIPLGDDLFRLTAWEKSEPVQSGVGPGEQHKSTGSAPTIEEIQGLVDQTVPGKAKILEAKALLRYRIESRLALSYSRSQAFIAGDACHVHPPTGSQGLNTGFQDAYNLGWKLASVLKGEISPELLESYGEERRLVGQWILTSTHQAAKRSFEMAGRRFYLEGNKLVEPPWDQSSVHYRDSPAVIQMQSVSDPSELQAGDRAPDGLLKRSGQDKDSSLHELFRGGKHHLLVFGGRDEELFLPMVRELKEKLKDRIETYLVGTAGEGWPQQETWTDPGGITAKAYSVKEATAVLVRPDRYVSAKVATHMVPEYLKTLMMRGERKDP
jgi:2-polyprenyl-6-methoxyphenol hydroxylase-like FAD-dependent oxidoreductase